MRRKLIVLAGAVSMILFQACQESAVLTNIENKKDSSTEIQFTNYVGGMTRASRGVGDTFVSGDQMEVYGIQTTEDGTTAPNFNKQLVSNVGQEIWSYSPTKYWEKNSTYKFYAAYPYSDGNSFDFDTYLFSVDDFTVKDTASQQIDLMIAQQITNHQPYNVVNFVFNHILSNVNFYIKTATEFNTTGISSVEVTYFDVTGLYSTGDFAQSGWNNNVFVGQWTPDATSLYDMPKVTNAVYTIGATSAQTLASDLLLLPQTINDNAKIGITFKLVYTDGTSAIFSRTVALNQIVGKKASDTESAPLAKWEPNYRYNYTISVNPSITEHGGEHLAVANPDHDQDDYANPDSVIVPNVNIITVGDTMYIDQNLDDVPDYPIIWKDIDGDGKEEGLPDRDKDGQPDDTDGDGNPDVIWMDTNNDGTLDTELERTKTQPEDPGIHVDPTDPTYPDTAYVDYDGNANGGYKQPTAWLVQDADGEYFIDLDSIHDGQNDIRVLWKDIDGDGKLEGIADKNGDGKLTAEDSYDNDGKDYLGNDNDYDVVLYAHVITNPDGSKDYEKDAQDNIIWYELEKPAPDEPVVPEVKTAIEFSAEVTDWNDDYNANYVLD